MKRKRLIIWITIVLVLIVISAAFAYGKMNTEMSAEDQTYFQSLNDYDWSKACPAAGCRNDNEE